MMSKEASVLEDAWTKVLELDFFSLLVTNACWGKKNTFPPETQFVLGQGTTTLPPRPIEQEISFFLSAFLNASYSVVAYLRESPLFRETASQFQRSKPEIYGRGSNGGLRTRAVHFAPVKPGFEGNLQAHPNPAMDELFAMAEEAGALIEMPPDPNHPWPSQFYFDESEPQDSIPDFCHKHYFEVQELVVKCREILRSKLESDAANGLRADG